MSRYCIKRLNQIEGYIPGEQPKEPNVIKLNTNENPYEPPNEVMQALSNITAEQLRKYPDPLAVELRKKIAKVYNLPSLDWIIVGNGMDEILSITVRTFVERDEIISATYPTYTLYEVLSQLHGCQFHYHELDENFCLTPPFSWTNAKLVFLTHPNAPTGVPTPPSIIESICTNSNQIIFIDEAYVDFCEFNYIHLPTKYPNVIVGRTFSKSFSLAGVRLGFAVANPELISDMMKTKDSYNVNAITQILGTITLEQMEYFNKNVEIIKQTRDMLKNELRQLGFTVPDSQSNFLLAIWNYKPTAEEIYLRLKAQNIFVRYFPQRRLENALRITVGTPEQCDILINALKKIIHLHY